MIKTIRVSYADLQYLKGIWSPEHKLAVYRNGVMKGNCLIREPWERTASTEYIRLGDLTNPTIVDNTINFKRGLYGTFSIVFEKDDIDLAKKFVDSIQSRDYEFLNKKMGEDLLILRRIVSSANRLKYTVRMISNSEIAASDFIIALGARHFDPLMHENIDRIEKIRGKSQSMEQGFIDQYGEWWNRKQALMIAANSNQLNQYRAKHHSLSELYSEDLW